MSDLLNGIRVVESGQLLNGATVGTLLGDLGADVIKIESPFRGDYIRDYNGVVSPKNSPPHIQVNKHKRSLALNLKHDAGKAVFRRLIQGTDIFIDGNRSGALEGMQVGYSQQSDWKPDIVYCQYTGYGAEGPYAHIPTHGYMMEALAAGHPCEIDADGYAVPAPLRRVAPTIMNDTRTVGGEATATGAIHAAFHAVAGLVQRWRTGRGCFIDAAASTAVIANAWVTACFYLNDHLLTDRGDLPDRDEQSNGWVKYAPYATSDGKVILFGAIEHKFWDNFCRAADRPDLLARKDVSLPVDYAQYDESLRKELRDLFVTRSEQAWLALALQYDFPLGPAPRDIGEVAADPHMQHRGIFHVAKDPAGNDWTYIAEPAMVAGQPYRVQRPAPGLGQHSHELLIDLGYNDDEVNALVKSQTVILGN